VIAQLKLAAAAGALVAAAAGGWVVSGWRASGVEASLRGRVAVLELALEQRDQGLVGRDAAIAELQGHIDSVNTVVARLGDEAEAAQLAREAERRRWAEERRRLEVDRDAALAGPWPEDCCELLREVARRAPR